ncbi:MAG TPA: response regulator [Actinoplanes sp.]|jgi:PAS domain S-box-containing protein
MATVLVVDDRATNRAMVRTILGYRGHRVIEAHEGAEALEIAHAEHPDLILTDVLMPGVDGYGLAMELRAAPDTAQTPIVFYTANYDEAETRPFAEACGVAKVLLKSTGPEELLAAVDELLNSERGPHPTPDTYEVAREHLRAVNAKLVEKAQALSDTQMRFKVMADSSPVGIFFGDRHGSADYVNARLAAIMQRPAEDLLGLGWLCCVGDDHHEEILATVRGANARDAHHRYRTQVQWPDGTLRWFNVQVQTVRDQEGDPFGFVGTVDDVTAAVEADQQRRSAERRHDLEAGIRASERLESLSRLAGGVAHDFNNILGVILAFQAFVSDSLAELGPGGRLPEDALQSMTGDLEQIRKAAERATGLTQQLLTFGSRSVISLTPLDLNQAVREATDMLTPTLNGAIRVVTQLEPGLSQVLAESTNIAQVMLNLVLNARDAMPDGGTLTITTSGIEVTDGDHIALPPGRYARLAVRDTGNGMTPEVLRNAVEPFFTTKGRGQGAGLGLATVYGIVTQLGGDLRIESDNGFGTSVTICLPTTHKPPSPVARAAAPSAGGNETILVAEDEDALRDSVTRMLSKAGYTVLAAVDGNHALELAGHHPGAIDLLLSDVMMPGMLGSELAARLTGQQRLDRVLFMSGFAGDPMNQHGALPADVTVVTKPFTEQALLLAVRSMLGAAHT